jgi:hypothetical protein
MFALIGAFGANFGVKESLVAVQIELFVAFLFGCFEVIIE